MKSLHLKLPLHRGILTGTTLVGSLFALAACSDEQTFANREGDLTPQGASGDASPDASGEQPAPPNAEAPALPEPEGAAVEEPTEEGRSVEEIILNIPSNRDFFAVQELEEPLLNCGQVVTLMAAENPDSSWNPVDNPIQWMSSDPEIVAVGATGMLTVTGFGSVTLVGLTTDSAGEPIQDHIEIQIAPPTTGFRVATTSPIAASVVASATPMGNTFTNVVNGKAAGRLSVAHAERDIALKAVDASVASSDFINMQFKDLAAPAKNRDTCLWESQFTLSFEFLYVGAVTQYTGQQITVSFADETGRPPLSFDWSAILLSGAMEEGQELVVVNQAVGAQGFSPLTPDVIPPPSMP